MNLDELINAPFFPQMILVEGGSFMMGNDDEDAYGDEQPIHKVTVKDFRIGKYPVTQALWKAVMENNPSCFIGDSRPVEQLSWDDTQIFIQKIKEKTGIEYRLPTEAEWDYAARGGQNTKGYQYAGSNKLKEVGWYEGNSHEETKPVGLKYPNELGLYDMSGSVWELCYGWCEDYSSESQTNPQVPQKGSDRVSRGGSWLHSPQYCRPSYRSDDPPDDRFNNLGFRLALG